MFVLIAAASAIYWLHWLHIEWISEKLLAASEVFSDIAGLLVLSPVCILCMWVLTLAASTIYWFHCGVDQWKKELLLAWGLFLYTLSSGFPLLWMLCMCVFRSAASAHEWLHWLHGGAVTSAEKRGTGRCRVEISAGPPLLLLVHFWSTTTTMY